ncbi:MAG: cupin domain-containing protein [Myxococcota bacterium]
MKLCVTGHDSKGKAIFSHAGAPPRAAGAGTFELWSTKGPISVPDDADPNAPAEVGYFPIEGETAFKLVSVPPSAGRADPQLLPEEIRHMFDPEDAGMHTTDTIDYVVIVAGKAELELDDGRKELVQQGDCVVQRGTRHAWRVVGDEPLVLAATLIGSRRT